jgi:cAMP-specific phosphodiesterase 4
MDARSAPSLCRPPELCAQNEIFQEQKKIRELVTRIQDAKVARRSETEESITKVLETPMQSAVAIIVELLGKAERRGEMTVAMPLTKVLTQISAANLHTPKFRFDDATNSNMRQWIADTFAPAVRAKVAAAGDDAAEEDRGGDSGGGSAAVPEPELAGSAGSDEPTCSPRSLAPAANTLPRLHFNQFSFREEELGSLVRCMFEDLGFFEEFKLPMHTFDAFMVTMRRGYNSENQYHNYRHAIDVTQMSYYFCTQTSAANILSKWDIFLLIVCCIAHDVDHNGLTNAFHVNSQSPLALMYNDISVMENHHSSYFLNVLAREETNLLANCEESLRKEAKQKMVNIILSTGEIHILPQLMLACESAGVATDGVDT